MKSNTMDKYSTTNERNELIKALEALALPKSIIVTSASLIKVDTVKKVMGVLFPNREFDITGVKAKSGINEQPVGEETELGAKNRISDAEQITGFDEPHVFISVENGIFPTNNNEYEDKAVIVIKLPDGRTFSEISAQGVIFPVEAIEATKEKVGGFKDNTVGGTIAEIFDKRGIKIDKQDPHSALTNNTITRRDQITNTIEDVFRKIIKA